MTIQSIILAAGIGSRLRPITLEKPKCMVKVNGIPIIEHQIRAYLKSGIERKSIHVVVGYKSDFIKDFINANYPGIKIIENNNFLSTNNMYSLYLTLKELIINDSSFLLISNGDCVYDPAIINNLVMSQEFDLITCDSSSHIEESMKIKLKNDKIIDISKEIPEEFAYAVSIDLYKIGFQSLQKLIEILETYILEKKELNLWTEVALKDLLNYSKFRPFDINGMKWVEIDNFEDLAEADIKFSALDLAQKKCFVMDLDGTVYLGNKPIEGTINFVNSHINNNDFYFLTNNTSRVPLDYVERLAEIGIETTSEKIISPVYPLLNYLRENEFSKIYFVANSKFVNYICNELKGLEITDDPSKCQAVILAYDTELTYEKLTTASLLLQKNENIQFLATHIDMFCPTEEGNIPDIGCMTLVIQETTGRSPDKIFGKPNKVLLENINKKYDNNEVVVVGDRLHTDKKLAESLDYDFICVLSGETKRSDIEKLKTEDFPALVVNNMGELLSK